MNKILQNISELNKKGFFHLITSGIINKIILFCSGIFLVKILSKSEYGIYSYYQNILTFFLFINGFGIASGFFQFGSKNIENKKKISYYKYSIKFSIFSSVVISLMIIIFSFNNKILIKGAQNYLLYISLLPFFYLVIDLITIDQRIKFENKKVAILSNANTFILIIFLLIGAKYGGISGIILGKYIGEIVTIILFFSFYKKIILEWKEIDDISKDEKYEINKFSFFSSINSVIAQLLYVIDIFLIGVLIKDENIIANYKAATLIPFALNFIPQTISNYFYPYFSKNYKNKEYIKDKYKKMFKYNLLLNIVITLLLIIFSNLIIKILFGNRYIDSIYLFRIFSVCYFFASTFRIPAGYILSAIGSLKYITYNSFICGILNVTLDIVMIRKYGVYGAALVTLIIFILSGILSNLFLIKILKNKI